MTKKKSKTTKPETKEVTLTRLDWPDGLHKITATTGKGFFAKVEGIKCAAQYLTKCVQGDGTSVHDVIALSPGWIPTGDDDADGVGERFQWLIAIRAGQVIGGIPASQPDDLGTIDDAKREYEEARLRREARRDYLDHLEDKGIDEKDEYDTSDEREAAFEDYFEEWKSERQNGNPRP